jgi:hypothetical protein
MLKNRAIAAAISSAILAFAQVDAAPAATPLTTKGAAAKPANPPNVDHAPGDYDRALIVQQAREARIQGFPPRKMLGTPHLDRSTTLFCCAEQGSRALGTSP